MLNENGLISTNQHHVPCMAHVLNLVIQGGFKELGNPSLTSKFSEDEDDEGCDEDIFEVSFEKAFREILRQLQKLFLVANNTPRRILQYTELCEKHKMPKKIWLSQMFLPGGIRHMTWL